MSTQFPLSAQWLSNRPKAWIGPFLAVLTALSAPAWPVGAQATELTDADGRTVAVEDLSRVVSIGGSVTEILYALGLQDRIVAVDTTSLYPAQALQDHPNVGYMRALSPEGILSMDPSLILAEEGSGPPGAVTLLETASVPFVLVPSEANAAGVADKIRFVAGAMGVAGDGEAMADAVTTDLETVEKAVGAIEQPVKALFVLSLANGRIMAAGDGTSAATMIEMAGGQNALPGFTGYKPVNDEAILEAAPEVIIMMARGDHAATIEEVLTHPALSRTPAAEAKRIVTMDGLYLLGFGPRVAQAVRDLAVALYPDLTPPALPERAWAATQ